ncbi:MAG: hypothetical protein AB7Q00_01845 [Phycisphaerales bacterium]
MLGYLLLVLAIVVGIAGVLAGVALGVHFGLPMTVIPQLALVFGAFCGLLLLLGGEKVLMLLRDLRRRHARRNERE